MDIATIVGLLAAFGLIFMAISENAPAFVDTASLLIVVAGSIAVVMARCSLGEFLGAMGVMGKAFSRKIDDPVELITQIVEREHLMGFGKADFPGQACIFDRGLRAGTCAAVVP